MPKGGNRSGGKKQGSSKTAKGSESEARSSAEDGTSRVFNMLQKDLGTPQSDSALKQPLMSQQSAEDAEATQDQDTQVRKPVPQKPISQKSAPQKAASMISVDVPTQVPPDAYDQESQLEQTHEYKKIEQENVGMGEYWRDGILRTPSASASRGLNWSDFGDIDDNHSKGTEVAQDSARFVHDVLANMMTQTVFNEVIIPALVPQNKDDANPPSPPSIGVQTGLLTAGFVTFYMSGHVFGAGLYGNPLRVLRAAADPDTIPNRWVQSKTSRGAGKILAKNLAAFVPLVGEVAFISWLREFNFNPNNPNAAERNFLSNPELRDYANFMWGVVGLALWKINKFLVDKVFNKWWPGDEKAKKIAHLTGSRNWHRLQVNLLDPLFETFNAVVFTEFLRLSLTDHRNNLANDVSPLVYIIPLTGFYLLLQPVRFLLNPTILNQKERYPQLAKENPRLTLVEEVPALNADPLEEGSTHFSKRDAVQGAARDTGKRLWAAGGGTAAALLEYLFLRAADGKDEPSAINTGIAFAIGAIVCTWLYAGVKRSYDRWMASRQLVSFALPAASSADIAMEEVNAHGAAGMEYRGQGQQGVRPSSLLPSEARDQKNQKGKRSALLIQSLLNKGSRGNGAESNIPEPKSPSLYDSPPPSP